MPKQDDFQKALDVIKDNYGPIHGGSGLSPFAGGEAGGIHLPTGGSLGNSIGGLMGGITTETIIGYVLGSIMFSVGFYLLKNGKRDGILIRVIVGLVMCVVPFFIVNPYIIVLVAIVGGFLVKHFDNWL